MRLREFFTPESVRLDLSGTTRGDILNELVDLLKLDERSAATLVKILSRREELGSTGVGRGIAIPHGRSLVVNNVRLAYGHHPVGVAYDAIDGLPVHHFFLIVAPPIEVSNQYLPILGKIAQFAKDPDVPERLAKLQTAEEFFELLEEKGV
jgi:mannitol/fructose-specific phosphotransferase system IIA component (Ntr-type)